MYTIRAYAEKDRQRVEAICLSPEKADTAKTGRNGGIFSRMLLTVFCRYYVEQEPHNCFVAVNEKDDAVGYILCAADFQVWKEKFTSLYLRKSRNPLTRAVGKGTIAILNGFHTEYPAHLHIDLAAGCQRQGLGTRLMDTLLKHLEENGVRGIMLSVEADNEKGVRFYRKYGFQELGRSKREITMGKKLNAGK
jgi:ribosomal protein S18 acetylase RimI-like enzyme